MLQGNIVLHIVVMMDTSSLGTRQVMNALLIMIDRIDRTSKEAGEFLLAF